MQDALPCAKIDVSITQSIRLELAERTPEDDAATGAAYRRSADAMTDTTICKPPQINWCQALRLYLAKNFG
jgi:hypothetical protein